MKFIWNFFIPQDYKATARISESLFFYENKFDDDRDFTCNIWYGVEAQSN